MINLSNSKTALRRTRLLLTSAIAMALCLPSMAQAQLVDGGDLIISFDSGGNPGQITITNPNATTADISVLAPAVVADWTQFNVPVNTTLNVSNGSAAATASLLNRILGATPSDLGGTINASDVNLWFINSNGILFGDNTTINANSFTASTLDVNNQDFFDFAMGTDLLGNGSDTVNFAGASTSSISSASGANITTGGTQLFVTQQLNLNGALTAGSGRVALVAASDVDVTLNPGSPLGYVVNAGTTVATQTIDGSISGAGVEFQMVSAAGIVGALLQVDASVTATTAVATETGILLQASGLGAAQPSVITNGVLDSSGTLEASVGGDYTATASLTGATVDIDAMGAITTAAVNALNGNIDQQGR